MNNGQPPTSVALYTEVHGSGDPILCLHGLGGSLFTWRHFITPFSQNHKLITVDFRGSGQSPKPLDTHYSIEEHANDIYEIIIKEDLTNLTLVGNSLGGAVALLVAIRLSEQDPSRLAKLVLISSGGDKKKIPLHLKLLRSFLGKPMLRLSPSRLAARMVLGVCYFDKSKPTREQVDAYAGPLANRAGKNALLQTARQCIPQNFEEILAKLKTLTVPTFILWGRQDAVIPVSVGEQLHQVIPNSTLEIIEQCGHIPQEENPDETIARVSKFLLAT